MRKSLTKINGVKVDNVSYRKNRVYLTVKDSVNDKVLVQQLKEDLSYSAKVLERTLLD